MAFPIERSHLADSHFRDTGQNMKYVAKIEKNVYAYSARKRGPRMLGLGKGKDADLGLCQDGSGTNKRSEAEWDPGQVMGLYS